MHKYKSVLQVGNKADLQADRRVDEQEAAQFAEQYGLNYIETSVLDQSNIQVIQRVILDELTA